MFDNHTLIDLLSQPHMYVRMKDCVRGHKYLDGGVVTALAKAGRKEFIHNPSLLQHTGKISSMGNGAKGHGWGVVGSHPDALTFPGEDFDAMELLPCETPLEKLSI